MPNQWLWVNLLSLFPATADPNGCTGIITAIPPNPAIVGLDFPLQWIGTDTAANPFGFVWSDAVRVVIRN
jgi:hypothetical protein